MKESEFCKPEKKNEAAVRRNPWMGAALHVGSSKSMEADPSSS